ncbi:MAG: amino acid permease [Clostridiaceae bacterium BRH_c20a]|nr:MAG: amino acid permease [Clostridiaceae bacterium BRH_c20a]
MSRVLVENSQVVGLQEKPALKRDLGVLESYATLIGILIGSGIFVVTGQAGAIAGPSVPLAYLLMMPIILATAAAYMVFMSTPLGNSPGGAYIHISRTFNSYYLGYIGMWLKWVAFIGALGVLSLSLGEYFTFFLPDANPVVIATLVLLFFFVVNLVGVKIYGKVQVVMFFLLLLAIAVLVIPGLFAVKLTNYQPLFPFGVKGMFAVMPSLFMSYAGFEALAQTAGETKDARKSIPKVFLRGILIAVLIYVLMSFVAFGVMPYQDLAQSKSAMADAANSYLPLGAASVVAMGAIMAFSTSINSTLMVPARILYVLAEERMIPKFLARLNPKYSTPDVSLAISTGIAILLLWTKTLGYMLNVALQAMFLLYIFHGIALVFLPFVRKELYKKAQVKLAPGVLVAVGLFSVICMILFSYTMILSVIKLFVVWIAVGTILYLYERNKAKKEGFDYSLNLKAWVNEDI